MSHPNIRIVPADDPGRQYGDGGDDSSFAQAAAEQAAREGKTDDEEPAPRPYQIGDRVRITHIHAITGERVTREGTAYDISAVQGYPDSVTMAIRTEPYPGGVDGAIVHNDAVTLTADRTRPAYPSLQAVELIEAAPARAWRNGDKVEVLVGGHKGRHGVVDLITGRLGGHKPYSVRFYLGETEWFDAHELAPVTPAEPPAVVALDIADAARSLAHAAENALIAFEPDSLVGKQLRKALDDMRAALNGGAK